MTGKPNSRISGTAKTTLALCASLLILAAAASSAPAATIGQVSPETDFGCLGGYDWVQAATVGNLSYEVPSGGTTITSWSTKAAPDAGQKMEFKVFRPTGGHGYSVVGQDGPRDLTSGTTNTFPVNIPVKPGDLLGLHTVATGACNSAGLSGDTVDTLFGDGAPGMFTPNERLLLNVSAVVTTSGGGGGGRAAALKKCKKKHGKKRKKCKKKAKRIPA